MNKGERTSFLGSQKISLPHLYKLNHTNQGVKVLFKRIDRPPVHFNHDAFLYYNKDKLKHCLDKFEEELIKDKLLACEIVNNEKEYLRFIEKNEEAKSQTTDLSSNYYNFQNSSIVNSFSSRMQFQKEMNDINGLFLEHMRQKKIERRNRCLKKRASEKRINNKIDEVKMKAEKTAEYFPINSSFVKYSPKGAEGDTNKEQVHEKKIKFRLKLPSRIQDKTSTECSFSEQLSINSSMFFYSANQNEGNFPNLKKTNTGFTSEANPNSSFRVACNQSKHYFNSRTSRTLNKFSVETNNNSGFLSDRRHVKRKEALVDPY